MATKGDGSAAAEACELSGRQIEVGVGTFEPTIGADGEGNLYYARRLRRRRRDLDDEPVRLRPHGRVGPPDDCCASAATA